MPFCSYCFEIKYFLAISVFSAIKNAIISKNQNSKIVNLIAPATPENILKSINNEI